MRRRESIRADNRSNNPRSFQLSEVITRFRDKQPALDKVPGLIEKLYHRGMNGNIEVIMDSTLGFKAKGRYIHHEKQKILIPMSPENSEYIEGRIFPLTVFHEAAHAHDDRLVRQLISEKLGEEDNFYVFYLSQKFSKAGRYIPLTEARAYFAMEIFCKETLSEHAACPSNCHEGMLENASSIYKRRGRILTACSLTFASIAIISLGAMFSGATGIQTIASLVTSVALTASLFTGVFAFMTNLPRKIYRKAKSYYNNLHSRASEIGSVEAFQESNEKLAGMIDDFLIKKKVKIKENKS